MPPNIDIRHVNVTPESDISQIFSNNLDAILVLQQGSFAVLLLGLLLKELFPDAKKDMGVSTALFLGDLAEQIKGMSPENQAKLASRVCLLIFGLIKEHQIEDLCIVNSKPFVKPKRK